MLKNYLVTAFRNFKQNIFYSLIIIVGLSIGIASSLIVLLFVQDELSYDKHHVNSGRIYKLGMTMTIGDVTSTQDIVNPATAELFKNFMSGIESYTRILRDGTLLIKMGDEGFYEQGIVWADPALFEIFSFNFLSGKPETALKNVNSIVLTRELAEKYFGDEDPSGRTLEVKGWGLFTVSAVIDDLPDNTTVPFRAVLPVAAQLQKTEYVVSPEKMGSEMGHRVYFLFKPGFTAEDFDSEYKRFLESELKGTSAERLKFVGVVENIEDTRLDSKITPQQSEGNRRILFGVISLGVFLLLLACVNYINLSTSKLGKRSKEIATRKVIGSSRRNLVFQFLSETMLYSVVSLLISFVLTVLAFKYTPLNELIGKRITFDSTSPLFLFAGGMILVLFTGFLGGVYPAFYLTRIKVVDAIKETTRRGKIGRILRNSLVVFQFVITVVAIATTILMSRQIDFLLNKDVGFDKKNVLVITVQDENLKKNLPVLKNELKNLPGVKNAAISNTTPGFGFTGYAFAWENEKGEMVGQAFRSMQADRDYFETMGIKLIQGDNFYRDESESSEEGNVIVNEALVKHMGWTKPLGKRHQFGKVIGVVKDFNYRSLHNAVLPMFISKPRKSSAGFINVRMDGERISETLSAIEKQWSSFAPGFPFSYTFLKDALDASYQENENQKKLTQIFSFVCILISCLGLFGLAAFTLERSTKEIGVRRVLGASVRSMITLLLRRFVKFVLIANIFAWPLAYFIMREWLQGFTYKVGIDIWIFILAGTAAVVISVVTLSYQVIKASKANPVESLRYE